jgi:hypothetical protein
MRNVNHHHDKKRTEKFEEEKIMFPTSWSACRRASLVWQRISVLFSPLSPSPSFSTHFLQTSEELNVISTDSKMHHSTKEQSDQEPSCLWQETRRESQRDR